MARRKQPTFIKGAFTHRRTESDYMGTLLDAVTLEDWREVVNSTVAAAKSGDPSARLFLAQYLMGKPDTKAPAPVTVVVQQLSGRDPVVEKLANRHIHELQYPPEGWKVDTKDLVEAELQSLEAQSARETETRENAGRTRLAAESPTP